MCVVCMIPLSATYIQVIIIQFGYMGGGGGGNSLCEKVEGRLDTS